MGSPRFTNWWSTPNPCYAFLLETNTPMQNKLVMAHVLGHCDFFKEQHVLQQDQPADDQAVSINADRVRKYEFEHGSHEVEEFLDAVLSIQEHIDPHQHMKQDRDPNEKKLMVAVGEYDDLLNLGEPKREEPPKGPKKFPEEPQKDILKFLAEHAPDLAEWQRDLIGIVREEQLYFVPQMQTKIMNEGWASIWHSRILRELELTDAEYTEFAQLHSSVLAPDNMRLNPYHLGFKLYEDIEKRWDSPFEKDAKKFGRTGSQGRESCSRSASWITTCCSSATI